MGGYDPERHQRRSIRLKAYDYSLPGPYFVTICVEHRAAVLGAVAGGETVLSPAGKIIANELQRIEIRSPGVSLDAAVVMPNHLHAIIAINPTNDIVTPVGPRFIAPTPPADHLSQHATTPDEDPPFNTPANEPRTADEMDSAGESGLVNQVRGDRRTSETGDLGAMNRGPTGRGKRPKPSGALAGTLGEVVRGFKAASARAVRRDCDLGFAWQTNYYERVIRNERELQVLAEYIETNPARWSTDEFNAEFQAQPRGER